MELPSNILVERMLTVYECAWARVFFWKTKEYNKQKARERSNLAMTIARKMPGSVRD
jgi:hypothetical protein